MLLVHQAAIYKLGDNNKMTTISTQRGAVVASSFTTLFTNSGSVNATRVITNGVNISNYGYACTCNIGGTLVVCPSGGVGYNIGIAGSVSYNVSCACGNTYTYGIQLYHDARIMPGMWWNGTAVPPPQPSWQISGASVACCMWIPSTTAGQNSCCAAGCPCLGSLNYLCGYTCPSTVPGCNYQIFGSTVPQFWLGASDAVKFNSRGVSCQSAFVAQGKGGYSYAAACSAVYVGYSFTLVSE